MIEKKCKSCGWCYGEYYCEFKEKLTHKDCVETNPEDTCHHWYNLPSILSACCPCIHCQNYVTLEYPNSDIVESICVVKSDFELGERPCKHFKSLPISEDELIDELDYEWLDELFSKLDSADGLYKM